MNNYSIISSVKNGKLVRNRNKIQDIIQSFEGKEIEISIKKKRRTRSNPQNRYYWSCVIPIVSDCIKEAFGEIWTTEKTHEFLKSKFLFHESVNIDTGEILKTPKSTTECSTVEFEEYIMKIRQFLMEYFETTLPEPNSEITLNF